MYFLALSLLCSFQLFWKLSALAWGGAPFLSACFSSYCIGQIHLYFIKPFLFAHRLSTFNTNYTLKTAPIPLASCFPKINLRTNYIILWLTTGVFIHSVVIISTNVLLLLPLMSCFIISSLYPLMSCFFFSSHRFPFWLPDREVCLILMHTRSLKLTQVMISIETL